MSITVSKSVDVEVDVDVDLTAADIKAALRDMSQRSRAQFLAEAFGAVPMGLGDGDDTRLASIIERAFLAAKALPNCPPEIAELFWVVHGRAMP